MAETDDRIAAIRRYDLVTNYRCGSSIDELERCDDGDWMRAEDALPVITAQAAELETLRRERIRLFPIQRERDAAAHPLVVPWSVAEKAHAVYSAKYGTQSLERLAQRGGFSPSEMDMFYPGWREESSEIASLRAEVTRLREAAKALLLALMEIRALVRGEMGECIDVERADDAIEDAQRALSAHPSAGEAPCGIEGWPNAGHVVCELPVGHDGPHQQGRVAWIGYHKPSTGEGE